MQDPEVEFKVGLSSLHRQFFALTRYACKRMNMPFVTDCQSEQLLSALAYFDMLAAEKSDQCARKLLFMMEEYVADIFYLIKSSKSWGLLSPQLVSRIVAKDCLTVKKEADVLGFVASYCTISTDEGIAHLLTGNAEIRAGASPAESFAHLVEHVRFPWITQAQLDTELAAGERTFVNLQPCLNAFLSEARCAGVQAAGGWGGRSGGGEGGEACALPRGYSGAGHVLHGRAPHAGARRRLCVSR